MGDLEQRIGSYTQAAQRGADWIEAQQQANGAIDPQSGVAAIYKTAFALVTAGRLTTAWRLMDYIASDLTVSPGQFSIRGEAEHLAAFYHTCYILKAALRLGRFDVASPAALQSVYQRQLPN